MSICQGCLQSGIGPPPPLVSPPGCRVGLPCSPRPTVLPKIGVCAEPEGGNPYPTDHHPHVDTCAQTDSANPGRKWHAGAAVTTLGRRGQTTPEPGPVKRTGRGTTSFRPEELQVHLSAWPHHRVFKRLHRLHLLQTGWNLNGSEASYGSSLQKWGWQR